MLTRGNSLQKSLCPVVVCPYLCSSDKVTAGLSRETCGVAAVLEGRQVRELRERLHDGVALGPQQDAQCIVIIMIIIIIIIIMNHAKNSNDNQYMNTITSLIIIVMVISRTRTTRRLLRRSKASMQEN